jgi:molybdenum cofactor biosynthesis enzyme MoaA
MKIQTFTIVAGSAACNAACPYCVSKMTGIKEIGFKENKINWRNLDKSCKLASLSGVTTVLITGKGEPTLYPDQLTSYLEHLKKFDFPLIELQTNGLILDKEFEKYKPYLKKWYELGLTIIAISIAHYKKEKNKSIFTPESEYMDLERLIKNLHEIGFSVRLSCVMVKGYIDNPDEVEKLIGFADKNKIEQLSIRKLGYPKESEDQKVSDWTKQHVLADPEFEKIAVFLQKNGNKLMTIGHGATVYDINGQNVCLTDALTIKPETDELRQIIYFPDGHLRYDWQHMGAVLI